jgi:hypothetical protein
LGGGGGGGLFCLLDCAITMPPNSRAIQVKEAFLFIQLVFSKESILP